MSAKKTRTRTVSVTIEVEADFEFELEDDDDGCGSPMSTGNSMTGRRGSHWVVQSAAFDPDKAVAAINECLMNAAANQSHENDDDEVDPG